jgi:hypothetical protein
MVTTILHFGIEAIDMAQLWIGRTAQMLLIVWNLSNASRVVQFTVAFNKIWWHHKSQIVTLTAINTTITVATEVASRTITAPYFSHQSQSSGFFVDAVDGGKRVNKQSMINIIMTIFASLLGGPVFYLKNRRSRFLFFVVFGGFNSVLSQCLAGYATILTFSLLIPRLIFDLIYCASIKFAIFEFGRAPILNANRVRKMWAVRIAQDFTTTCIKVIILNIYQFRG